MWYCDDLSWLDNIIRSVRGLDVDSKELLAERLGDRYRAIRAFHGTRTADLESIYQRGLAPLDPKVVQEKARQMFVSDTFPEVTAERLQEAIERCGYEKGG